MNAKQQTLKNGFGNGLIVSGYNDIHSIYKTGEVVFMTTEWVRIKPTNEIAADFKFSSEGEDLKPHCFPLSALTEQITVEGYNDGKPFIPMEELIKIDIKWTENDSDLQYRFLGKDRLVRTIATWKHVSSEQRHYSDSFKMWLNKMDKNESWINYQLHRWHFNVFNLPSEEFIDARKSKVYQPK